MDRKRTLIKLIVLSLITFFGCYLSLANSPASGEVKQVEDHKSLRFLNFNLYLVCVGPACRLADSPRLQERQEQIAAFVKEVDPDVIFFQEIWQREQFEFLKTKLNYPHAKYFGESSDMVFFSKFPIENEVMFRYRWVGSSLPDCKRIFVNRPTTYAFADMILPDGKRILLGNLHALPRRKEFEGFRSPEDIITPERLVNVLEFKERLRARLQERRYDGVILGGDYNTNQQSRGLEYFEKQIPLQNALRESLGEKNWRSACTYCEESSLVQQQGGVGEGILDHLFYSPPFELKTAQIDPRGDSMSDHRPVIVDLRMGSKSYTGIRFGDVDRSLLDSLSAYIASVELNAYCVWSFFSRGQRREALEFLRTL